jgi:hypothetical protein
MFSCNHQSELRLSVAIRFGNVQFCVFIIRPSRLGHFHEKVYIVKPDLAGFIVIKS